MSSIYGICRMITVGSVEIAVIMMGKKIMSIGESVTEADFEGLDDNEVAKK